MTAFLVTVRRTEDGETIEDRMQVDRDTAAEAETVGLAAFEESGHEWTLVDIVEVETEPAQGPRFEPLVVELDEPAT